MHGSCEKLLFNLQSAGVYQWGKSPWWRTSLRVLRVSLWRLVSSKIYLKYLYFSKYTWKWCFPNPFILKPRRRTAWVCERPVDRFDGLGLNLFLPVLQERTPMAEVQTSSSGCSRVVWGGCHTTMLHHTVHILQFPLTPPFLGQAPTSARKATKPFYLPCRL